jgi:hypothetical protein
MAFVDFDSNVPNSQLIECRGKANAGTAHLYAALSGLPVYQIEVIHSLYKRKTVRNEASFYTISE